MDLILFSGNSLAHKQWILDVEESLAPMFDKTYAQMYKHWEDRSPVIYLDEELEKVLDIIKEYEDYAIFGKSAGALLALKGIREGIFKPQKCIFVGLPVDWGRVYGFKVDDWSYNYSVPTLFIQKSFDPVMFYEDLVKYIKEQNITNSEVLEISGNDHYYGDLNLLKEETEKFIYQK